MRKTISTLMLLLFIYTAGAQNNKAMEILTAVQNSINSYGNFRVAFSINGEKASIDIKENMFKMQSQGIIIWFNGDEQWTYIEESNEVNLTNPENSELNAVNPYHFLKNWHETCTCTFKGEKNIKGKNCKVVELKNKNISDFDNINILINQNNEITGMTITDANGDEFQIEISTIEKNLSFDDSHFEFYEKDYPNTDIIDLR